MYKLLKRFLFLLDPEKAHHLTFSLIRFAHVIPGMPALLRAAYSYENPRLKKTLFGITFKNPVGLAAGLDKDAKLFNELGNLGFGFIEIGTVTPKPQPGNDKPRLFRLVKDEAIINRMGFNNEGVKAAAERLKKRKDRSVIIGGNIGKNKATPNEEAIKDYETGFQELFDVVDYFVVNVSSPNTPNLRDLQEKEPLTRLLNHLQTLNNSKPAPKPILLKIAPDLTDSQLDDIIDIVKTTRLAGVIATNTTISREGLSYPKEDIEKIGMGGLSGKPLTKRSTEVIRYLKQKSGNAFPVIGVGGIHSAADAVEKIKAGADLLQLYTGFIYEGPALVKQINKAIVNDSALLRGEINAPGDKEKLDLLKTAHKELQSRLINYHIRTRPKEALKTEINCDFIFEKEDSLLFIEVKRSLSSNKLELQTLQSDYLAKYIDNLSRPKKAVFISIFITHSQDESKVWEKAIHILNSKKVEEENPISKIIEL